MPNVTANGIQIEYDTFGDSSSPPLLLIVGAGGQMVFWNEEFCQGLADKGLFVIRFDNRDEGLSTKFEEAGDPDVMAAITASMQGQKVETPYTLDDMADDAVGLLNALGIDKAHICGSSMGAAITQTIGYRHPSRILSLIPMSGTTGNPVLPQGNPEAWQVVLTPIPEGREEYIELNVKAFKIFWGALPFDEEDMRKLSALQYDRAFYPQGMRRQIVATIAQGNRKPRLGSITAPTLVIHGAEDPLFPVECGEDIVDAVPGAELLIIEGMGHPFGRAAWPQIIDAIATHTSKVAG